MGVFHVFLNYTNGIKPRNPSQNKQAKWVLEYHKIICPEPYRINKLAESYFYND